VTIPPPVPKQIKAPVGSTRFEITWRDGAAQIIPNAILRGYCPCAGCQGHSGPVAFQVGRNSDLIEVAPVGNYGLKFAWGDRHDTGIYTFSFLRKLGDLYASHGDDLPKLMPMLEGR
jgi:DUF971 family protein